MIVKFLKKSWLLFLNKYCGKGNFLFFDSFSIWTEKLLKKIFFSVLLEKLLFFLKCMVYPDIVERLGITDFELNCVIRIFE